MFHNTVFVCKVQNAYYYIVEGVDRVAPQPSGMQFIYQHLKYRVDQVAEKSNSGRDFLYNTKEKSFQSYPSKKWGLHFFLGLYLLQQPSWCSDRLVEMKMHAIILHIKTFHDGLAIILHKSKHSMMRTQLNNSCSNCILSWEIYFLVCLSVGQ